MRKRLVLSPCGTSLLNGKHYRSYFDSVSLSELTNLKERDIDKDRVEILKKALKEIEKSMLSSKIEERKQRSAELNALYTLENDRLSKDTLHILLKTDTFLGDATADIVEKILRSDGVLNVQPLKIGGLRTLELQEFRLALADLVKWADDTMPGYKGSGYEIIFNLTGGFKSIQGFLQSLAPFYADRTVYIFESGEKLLEIPVLPVVQNDIGVIEENLETFRRLAIGLKVERVEVEKIPPIYRWEVEGEYSLNEWGTLSFSKAKKEIYGRSVYKAPSEKIEISSEKLKELNKQLDRKRKSEFNETMDDLALLVEKGKPLKSSTFKKIEGNRKGKSTHECYLNSDVAERIYCHYENGRIVVDEVGEHL